MATGHFLPPLNSHPIAQRRWTFYLRAELYDAHNALLATHGTNLGSKPLPGLRGLTMELDPFANLRR